VEIDPRDNSVGYSGLLNEDGIVDEPSRRMGAVGAIRNIKTPSKVAQRGLPDTDHMFLVGEGALRFAKAEGFEEENLLTEESRIAWLAWKRSVRDKNGHSNRGPGLDAPPSEQRHALLEDLRRDFPHATEAVLTPRRRLRLQSAAWCANSGPLWGFAHNRRRLAARSGCLAAPGPPAAGRKICALPDPYNCRRYAARACRLRRPRPIV
jgi:hypothetical protein